MGAPQEPGSVLLRSRSEGRLLSGAAISHHPWVGPRWVLPRGLCSLTHGPTSPAPKKRLPYVGKGLSRSQQYPPAGSSQRRNPCSIVVSDSSPLGG